MKLKIATAAFVVSTAGAWMQSPAYGQMTGVSQPDQSPITATEEAAPRRFTPKPAASTPVGASPNATINEVYGAYVPYRPAGSPPSTQRSQSAFDPDANIVTSVDRSPQDLADIDRGIVTSVPEREGELREGTLMKMRISRAISTESTVEGSEFTATLAEPVEKDGRVILPAGAIVDGRVTEVRSGKRISGAAKLHLEPHSVTLPDGTQYLFHAQLIDTSQGSQNRVSSEGTVLRRDHAKETMAVVGGVTGAGAVAGAVIGGGPGAIVGAAIGAGAGTIVWLKQDRQATLPQDTLLIFSLTMPMELKPLHLRTMGGQ